MPKLYTKTGDKGFTTLYDMTRVEKNSIHFDIVGTTDELSAQIGMLIAVSSTHLKDDITLHSKLRKIQSKLLDIGSDIATTKDKIRDKLKKITENDVKDLESWIDYCESKNEMLKEFVLTGVNIADAQAHICRTTTRKLEREMWNFFFTNSQCKTNQNTFQYINRLSDFFFALSRFLSECKEVKRSEYN